MAHTLAGARVDALLAFAAALLALRLSAQLARRWRAPPPRTGRVDGSLLTCAAASAALAWGAAGGWGDEAFRVYYLSGALLTAPLLGAGSLLLVGRRWAAPAALVWVGLAVGVMVAVELTEPVSGSELPAAQDHLELFPARVLAIAGNSLGTLAAVGIAAATIRRRPLGNARGHRRGRVGRARLPASASPARLSSRRWLRSSSTAASPLRRGQSSLRVSAPPSARPTALSLPDPGEPPGKAER